MRTMTAAVVAVAVLVSACGGDSDDATSADTPTSEIQATTSDSSTTTVRPTTTSSPPMNIEPSDPVVVACVGNAVAVYRIRPARHEYAHTVVYRTEIGDALDKIGLDNEKVTCESRMQFNQDFSLYATSGTTTGGVSHAVVVDLAAGTATDLTAPRQTGGFSSGTPLDETAMEFESEPGRIFLTNRAVVRGNTGTFLVDPSDIEGAVAADDYAGPPAKPSDPRYGTTRVLANPDGRLVLTSDGEATTVTDLGTGLVHEIPPDCSGAIHGWRDSTTAVVTSAYDDTRFLLVSVDDRGVFTGCKDILPPSDRFVAHARLRVDGQALVVTVEGVDGYEYYEADLSTPGAEPDKRGKPWDIYGFEGLNLGTRHIHPPRT